MLLLTIPETQFGQGAHKLPLEISYLFIPILIPSTLGLKPLRLLDRKLRPHSLALYNFIRRLISLLVPTRDHENIQLPTHDRIVLLDLVVYLHGPPNQGPAFCCFQPTLQTLIFVFPIESCAYLMVQSFRDATCIVLKAHVVLATLPEQLDRRKARHVRRGSDQPPFLSSHDILNMLDKPRRINAAEVRAYSPCHLLRTRVILRPLSWEVGPCGWHFQKGFDFLIPAVAVVHLVYKLH